MKQTEIDALKNAFNIPEPQHKREFINKYKAMEDVAKRPSRLPLFLSFATTVIGAIVLICVCMNLKMTGDIRNQFNNSGIIEETTTNNSETTKTNSKTQTTESSLPKLSTENTTVNEEIVTEASENQITVSPTTTKKIQQTEISTVKTASQTTVHTSQTAVESTTTFSKTISTTKSSGNTTTTISCPGYLPVTSSAERGGDDYTIIPDRVYYNDGTAEIVFTSPKPTSGNDTEVDSGNNGIESILDTLINNSDTAVNAVTLEKIYTEINGVPYIQYNVIITGSPFGDESFKNGDKISIFVKGGYITAKDYRELTGIDTEYPDEQLIFLNNSEMEELEIGKTYLFFICGKRNNYFMPYGDSLYYVFTEENGKYVSVKNEYIVLE